MASVLAEFSRLFQPTTFRERGVRLPLTSPVLAGACLRASARNEPELVLPNPDGGDGFFVWPWRDLREVCRVSIHDVQLLGCITTGSQILPMTPILPVTVARAAHKVAASGIAGRAAMDAARSGAAVDEEMARAATGFMLESLARHCQTQACPVPAEPDGEAASVSPLRRLMAALYGRPANDVVRAIEELSVAISAIGFGEQAEQARVPRLLAAVEALHETVTARLADMKGTRASCAEFMSTASGLIARGAQRWLAEARTRFSRPVGLLSAYLADPEPTTHWLQRADWLLNGWCGPCVRRLAATNGQDWMRDLEEMVALVPMLPREAEAWLTPLSAEESRIFRSRPARLRVERRSHGDSQMLIAHEESLRAASLRMLGV